ELAADIPHVQEHILRIIAFDESIEMSIGDDVAHEENDSAPTYLTHKVDQITSILRQRDIRHSLKVRVHSNPLRQSLTRSRKRSVDMLQRQRYIHAKGRED